MSEKRVRMSAMRRYSGKALRESSQNYPQASGFFQADTTDLLDLKAKWKEEGRNASVTAFIVKAMAIALADFPELNARADGDYIIMYDDINVAVGIADEKGLFPMVVRNAEKKSVNEISDEIKLLTQKVRENKVVPEDMHDATVTISSQGTGRTEIFTSIISSDQALTLGVGRSKPQPVVDESGNIVVRTMTWLATNMNHILVDGRSVSGFRNRLAEILEHPLEYFT